MFDSKNIAEALLDTGAFKVSLDPLFTWSSGIKSPVYCDLRSLNSNVEVRRQIVDAFIDLIIVDDVDVIAGTSTAGIAWAAWIAEKLNKPMVYVRGTSKGHGTKKRVEGRIEAGQRVLVIEDLISTGGSSVQTVEALREDCDAVVTDILAITTYEMAKSETAFAELGVKFQTLTNFSAILDVTMNRGEITDEQLTVLKDFSADPAGWADRNGLA
ncbi:MAG: orotate phosphoribosyltransferase [Oceanicoccus sp.]|jgi:orotate phosphoribosyltransferase